MNKPLAVLLPFFLALSGCSTMHGSGTLVDTTRQTEDFSSVQVSEERSGDAPVASGVGIAGLVRAGASWNGASGVGVGAGAGVCVRAGDGV